MHHPAVEFMLKHLQEQTAIRKVITAINAEELEVPVACERCEREIEDMYQFYHLNGYSELHQYDITWLCMACAEKLD